MRGKIIFLMILILIGSANAAELKEYGIDDLGSVRMSYKYEGGESLYGSAQVDIHGNGEAICSFQYLGTSSAHRSNFHLKQSAIENFIKEYAKLKFLDYDFKKITDSSDSQYRIYDAGYNTLSFQDKNRNKTVRYQSIKTREIQSTASLVPINEDASVLAHLQRMYGSIISQKEYLYKLKDYQTMDKGVLANLFSSLEAQAGDKEILDAKEFVPVIMEIISSKEMCDSIGQYALGALEKITGEKPAGDCWDCNKWLAWWQKNKDSYDKN